MSDIVSVVRTQIASCASDHVGTRVYHQTVPQSADLPFVVIQKVSGSPLNTLSGPGATENARIQVDCLATTDATAHLLAEAVKGSGSDGLNGWSDETTDPAVSSCLMLGENDGYEDPADGSDNGVHMVTQEYSVWFS